MPHLLLPDLPPLQAPPAAPNAATANRLARVSQQERVTTFAAAGSVVRIPYGQVRMGGWLFYWHFSSQWIYLGYEFGLGEIEGFQTIYLDGLPILTGGAHGDSSTVPGRNIVVSQYHGTSGQGVPAANIIPVPGYADDLVIDYDGTSRGVAYLAFKIRYDEVDGEPQVDADIKGMKVLDTRTSSTEWSDNPALILNDLLTNTLYGQGRNVDATSVDAVADDNDELVPLVTGEKRRTLNLVLDTPAPVSDWVDVIAGDYAGCFIVPDADGVKLVSDRPLASSRTFAAGDVLKSGGGSSMRTTIEGLSKAPTVVRVAYTDTTTEPWSESVAEALATGVSTNAVPRRVQRISLPGINNHEEANRAAVERLNKQFLTRETLTFSTRDTAIEQQVGDVVTVGHWRGYSGATFRITAMDVIGPGRWRITARLYDANVYSDAVVAGPTQTQGDDIDPFSPPAVDSVSAWEEIVPDQGGESKPHVRVEFPAVDWPHVSRYRVEVVGPGFATGYHVFQEAPGATVVSSRPFTLAGISNPAGESVTVRVFTISTAGDVPSTAATATLTAKGRYRKPPDVTGLTAVFEGGVAKLAWEPVFDIGRVFYKVRVASTDTGWDAALAAHKGHLSATEFVQSEFLADDDETFVYYVKAQDNVRLLSENAAKIVVSTDTGEIDNRRTVSKNLWAEDFADVGFGNTEADFVYGDAEYWVSNHAGHTLANRIGAAGAWTNPTDEWYKHHTTFSTQPVIFNSSYTDFDLITERMSVSSVQAEWEYFNSSAPSTTGVTVFPNGSTYGVEGSFGASKLYPMDEAKATCGIQASTAPDLLNDYVEFKMPIRIKSKEVESIQGATVTSLDETDLTSDYTITFDPPYLAAPRFQFHPASSDVSVIVGLKSISATTAVLQKLSGPTTFSWELTWNSIGQ